MPLSEAEKPKAVARAIGIDPDLALAATPAAVTSSWDPERVVLYHLGIGAGTPPTDERELRYVDETKLVVLPTFCMVPAAAASTPAITGPGLEYDPAGLLHGEHELEMFAPIPVTAETVNTARIESVWDKGHAAVFVVRTETALADGTPLCRNRLTLFVRGAGGFGGDPGPKTAPDDPPAETVYEIEIPTIPQLNAIFRLTGDRTPLHLDPAAARAVGLPRPSVAGLCTWGIVGKALVDHCLDGDTTAIRRFSTRFTGSLFPGETVVVRHWTVADGIAFDSFVKERRSPLLSRGTLTTV